MYDIHLIGQIQKCIPLGGYSSNRESYDFPLEMVLYQLMKSAEVEDIYGGVTGLQRLFQEYTDDRPVLFCLKELLDDQWIRIEFDEWHPTIWHFQKVWLDKVRDNKLRETLAFLLFLHDIELDFHKKAIVREPETILCEARNLFPNIPGTEWFVEKQILETHADGYAFCSGIWHYSHIINAAAALLWVSDINHDSESEKRRWLDIVCACNATSDVLNHLSGKHRTDLLNWIVDTSEKETWLGNIDCERKFVTRLILTHHINTLAGKAYDRIDETDLYPTDMIERLHFVKRSHYDSSLFLCFREKTHFHVSALFEFFAEIPCEARQRASELLFGLHSVGYFSRPDVTNITGAEAIAEFTEYEDTQFLSVYLLLSYVTSDRAFLQYALSVLEALCDSILSGSIRRLSRCRANPAQISLLIQYLISCCDFSEKKQSPHDENPKNHKDLCFSVLAILIGKLRTDYNRTKPILKRTVSDIGDALERAEDYKKSRLLACLVTIARIVYNGDTAVRKDDVYADILEYLNEFYQSVWNNDYTGVYSSPFDWLHPVWYDVYSHTRPKYRERYRTPMTPADIRRAIESNEYNKRQLPRDRALIQIGILCCIATAEKQYKSHDRNNEIQKALYDCLIHYQRDARFDIFHIDNPGLHGNDEIFRCVGAYVDSSHESWKEFIDALSNATVEQLVLWLSAVSGRPAEIHFRKLLDTELEQGRLPADDIIHTDILISLIQEYRVEKLYDWCEKTLNSYLSRLKQFKENPMLEDRRRMASNQLYAIYYLQKRYDLIETGDNLFFKGVLLLDRHDPLAACTIFEQLSKTQTTAAVYLNWLYGYVMQLQVLSEASEFDACWAKSAKVIEQANLLCNDWTDEQREHYAFHLVSRHELKYGEDEEYIRKIEMRLNLKIDRLARPAVCTESTETDVKIHTIDTNTDDSNSLSFPVSRYLSQGFAAKSRTYLEIRGSAVSKKDAYEIMLLKFVLVTLQSVQKYSAQLYKSDMQIGEYENRYTELFREMFNHAYGEFWNVVCSDQENSGPTGASTDRNGGISGIDLTFYVDGQTATIGEAIFLRKLTETEKRRISDHIGKHISSSNGYTPLFFIVYYCGDEPEQFLTGYMRYIMNEFPRSESSLAERITGTIPFEKTVLYDEGFLQFVPSSHVLCTDFSYASGRRANLYHVVIDIRNAWSRKLARNSRSKQNDR